MTNLLHRNDKYFTGTTNIRKSHCHSQCILQLVCEDRVLFELTYWFLRARSSSSIQNVSEQFVTFIHPSFETSLFIQPHKQNFNSNRPGDPNSSLLVTIQY